MQRTVDGLIQILDMTRGRTKIPTELIFNISWLSQKKKKKISFKAIRKSLKWSEGVLKRPDNSGLKDKQAFQPSTLSTKEYTTNMM